MTDTLDLRSTTLAILAGGRSSRMGFAKSLLQIEGKPILRYLLDVMDWPGKTLLVTAPGREHPPGHELFDAEAIDPVEQGPLRGIHTALQYCGTPWMVVITLDMPVVRRQHLARALEILAHNPELKGLMFRDGAGDLQPFPFACRAAALQSVAAQIEAGKFAVHSLADLPGFRTEPAPLDWHAELWTNLNRPEDFDEYRLKQKRPLSEESGR